MCLDLTNDILIANAVMLNGLRRAFDIANQANEQGIANFIAERIDMHAKWDWQLKATTYQGM
jgi:DNA-binding ferritin-like protein